MAEPVAKETAVDAPPEHKPFVSPNATIPEFTWPSVLLGAVLGILFGASSLYLLLKVGMTVSASVPIAVLSITLFRVFSRAFGFRRATILENNIVQTAGSAGESLAFGVGVTMPALLLLGFEMDWVRVLTVAALGGVLGILMMIPLRRAFIVKQHGKLKYPEGTACAEVLVAGEKGGMTAKMVFVGFGVAFFYKWLTGAFKLWPSEPGQNLYGVSGGQKFGLKGAALGGDLSPEMMGVGYLIGPRIACLMMAGAVLSFWVIGPLIATFGEHLDRPVAPAVSAKDEDTGEDKGLIRNMGPDDIYKFYLRYIGAGAVAAGGIIGMLKALPLIVSSIVSGIRDLRASRAAGTEVAIRTERDMSMATVLFGSLALVVAMMCIPQLGLGFTLEGFLGAVMILLFGFLFVTVSSRLTGEVGSSSNPISGMTIATLLLTCLIFLLVYRLADKIIDPRVMLTALSIAAVVCIASSNGGTTSQDLKTGFLVGATPKYQQWAILVGALTSAVVIGGTMLVLNAGGTHYTNKGFPADVRVEVPADAPRQKVGRPHEGEDSNLYRTVYVPENKYPDVPEGWYLVDDEGHLKYRIDVPIKRDAKIMDNGEEAPERFKAPQPQLFAIIIKGILGGSLEWGLVVVGALIAIVMELMGISSLPVAVGMYLGLSTATPIFLGGLLRWGTDRWRGVSASEAETETSPGVLLSSGYIAGGTLCGLLIGFLVMLLPPDYMKAINYGQFFGKDWDENTWAKIASVVGFVVLGLILLYVGSRKDVNGGSAGAASPPNGPDPGAIANKPPTLPRE
jgi:putative OPT family oligopeptide transporter